MKTPPRSLRIAREAALTIGAIAGVACVLLALLPIFGVRPLVVTSGSMEPEISTGALTFARSVDATDLRVGDVVSVREESGARVTHRIESVHADDGLVRLTLRGDANEAADAQAYEISRADRVLFSVDGLGYALDWLRSSAGLVVAGAISVGLLWLAFRDGAQPERRRRSRGAVAGATALAIVAVAGASAYGLGVAEPTRAAWTDKATARTGQFGATTVLPPASRPVCTNKGGLLGLLGYAELTWAHRDAAYSYAYTITRVSTGQIVATGTVPATGAVGSTVVLDVETRLLSGVVLANTQFDVTVRSALTGSSGWQSAGSWTTRVESFDILLLGLSMRCGSGDANRVGSSTNDSQLLTTNLKK